MFVRTVTSKAAPCTIGLHPFGVFLALPSVSPLFTLSGVVRILAIASSAALHTFLSHPVFILLAFSEYRPKLALVRGRVSIFTVFAGSRVGLGWSDGQWDFCRWFRWWVWFWFWHEITNTSLDAVELHIRY